MDNEQDQFNINYEGAQVPVTTYSDGINTFFTVHLPNADLQLAVAYIDDNPVWVENDRLVTERAEKIGRLIEEHDGR